MRVSRPRLALAALSALAAATVLTATASAAHGGNEISVQEDARIGGDGTVTLSGTYRCAPPSPVGTVQIAAAVLQEGTRLGFGGGEADCDGEVHRWEATGTLRLTPDVHPGAAAAEVRLQEIRRSGGLLPTSLRTVAEDRRDIELHPSR
ncbi:DUF6299 family protein [Streptomyces antarcticus]|uniref:DUF6299 family protein n=1 Tax=Streptomyces antarcticus TaxID=2996458 RepID=UPI002271DBB5|nr:MULTISPECIES: DUF6299 family protein [unclassified Streptomyces]MCY0945854.1 DUF6299 family protein [Streptomyces sp. H34-AA3]MCZ4085770.1 DUF6299 family protein [Streptomyces sp. H34-S5]